MECEKANPPRPKPTSIGEEGERERERDQGPSDCSQKAWQVRRSLKSKVLEMALGMVEGI